MNETSDFGYPSTPRTFAEIPAHLDLIYTEMGTVQKRLCTDDEMPHDFERIRVLVHRYASALTPFCLPRDQRPSVGCSAGAVDSLSSASA